tara:strand:+ start:994 stop:1218 length:225 start_codon:yes stop_codon:yes gene_type:complete
MDAIAHWITETNKEQIKKCEMIAAYNASRSSPSEPILPNISLFNLCMNASYQKSMAKKGMPDNSMRKNTNIPCD